MFAEATVLKRKTCASQLGVIDPSTDHAVQSADKQAPSLSTGEPASDPDRGHETRLVQFAQAGDLTAFNQLVLAYQDRVYRWVFSLVTDEDLAQDLAQTTFILAFQKINTFRGGSFPAWLFKIARNLCYDELRRKQRRPFISLDGSGNAPDSDGLLAVIASPDPLPEETVQEIEQAETIARLLASLPGGHQQVLRLVDMEGLDYQEAAQILGLPLGTIKSRLSRARINFRQLLIEADLL